MQPVTSNNSSRLSMSSNEEEVKQNSSKKLNWFQRITFDKEKKLANKLYDFPKLKLIADVVYSEGFSIKPDEKLKQIGGPILRQPPSFFGKYCLIFKEPNAKTERWAGAVLDELSNNSLAMIKISKGIFKETIDIRGSYISKNYEHSKDFPIAHFIMNSVNHVDDKLSGSGEKTNDIKSPVFGIGIDKTTKLMVPAIERNRWIKVLVFNSTETKTVMTILSLLQDFEDQIETLFPKPLVEIIRQYHDWVDTGSETRNDNELQSQKMKIKKERDDKESSIRPEATWLTIDPEITQKWLMERIH